MARVATAVIARASRNARGFIASVIGPPAAEVPEKGGTSLVIDAASARAQADRMELPRAVRESYVVGRAVVRVLSDSTRTAEIHKVEEITGKPRYRRILDDLSRAPGVDELLRVRPELCSGEVDYEALRALPADTLGATYARHLDDNGLTADYQASRVVYVDDPDLGYLMRRFRQTHDVWHALLGLGIHGHEEVVIHAFSFGQLKLPVSAMIVLFGSLKHMVLERRWDTLRHSLREAYELGRDAAPLLGVHWERLWEQPIDIVRATYRLRPLTRAWLD
jgi:ubiquinone biosynthesis protein COQ4